MSKIDISNVRIPGTNLRGGRAIAVGILALYVLLFILLNRRDVEVNFVFFKIRSNELLALIVVLALGFAAGFIMRGRRQAAGLHEAPRSTPEAGTEGRTPTQLEQVTPAGHDDGPADLRS